MNTEIEVLPSTPESLQAKVDRLVKQRLSEIVGRKELSFFEPFFESKKLTDEIRRLQTAPDWHKWRVYYETWGCFACGERERGYHMLGMCVRCFRRTAHRLNMITRRLNVQSARAEDLIANERLAWMAYRKTAPPEPRKRFRDPSVPKWTHRPHLKPQMHPEHAGPRMRQLRELAGLSQRRLAEMAGVTALTVLKFEEGKRQPLPQNCEAIKRVLVEWFVKAFWP